jgi:hypothetical protein
MHYDPVFIISAMHATCRERSVEKKISIDEFQGA